MAERWRPERVTALAPDSASDVAGRRLAIPTPWSDVGYAYPLLWGACQGSGSTPYSVAVDVSEPSYRCSCPSRKFPCKHVLGLLYLWAEGRIDEGGTLSRFAAQWSATRAAGDRPDASPDQPPEKTEAQLAAAAARAVQREERVTAGLEELDRWLADQVTAGLGNTRPGAFSDLAARMVDAQVPGVAGRLRDLARRPMAARSGARAGGAWLDDTLAEYGLLHLLCRAWTRTDLPDALRATVRSHIGFTVPKETVLATPPVADTWAVVGMRDSDEEQVSTRRVWLYGTTTSRYALVLFFAQRGMPLDGSLVPGSGIEADLHFYPGGPALRALVGDTRDVIQRVRFTTPNQGVGGATAAWRRALAEDPWLGSYPCLVRGRARLTPSPGLVDDDGGAVRLVGGSTPSLLALTGGHPTTVFGELDPRGLLPTAVLTDDGLVVL
ncbi:MAG: SWIM zinc finger family protein [Propionibacteriaceae bacterium]